MDTKTLAPASRQCPVFVTGHLLHACSLCTLNYARSRSNNYNSSVLDISPPFSFACFHQTRWLFSDNLFLKVLKEYSYAPLFHMKMAIWVFILPYVSGKTFQRHSDPTVVSDGTITSDNRVAVHFHYFESPISVKFTYFGPLLMVNPFHSNLISAFYLTEPFGDSGHSGKQTRLQIFKVYSGKGWMVGCWRPDQLQATSVFSFLCSIGVNVSAETWSLRLRN